MKSLEPPDIHYLNAAQGWLELGNLTEAQAELERISVERQGHPAVLHVRWELSAVSRKWEKALEMASRLIELDPEEPLGWVHRSYALHELKRTAEARDSLLRVVEKFPVSATMRYNLACYECQLGRLEQARRWLQKAFRMGEGAKIRAAALQDADLKPLWPEIANL